MINNMNQFDPKQIRDTQDAVEATRMAESYRRESVARKFSGNKEAAAKYLVDRDRGVRRADKTIYQLPVNETNSSVVELGDGSRLYRKQLVKFGSYVNPNNKTAKMDLDRPWAERVVANFKNKVLNRVPVAEGHPKDSAELVTKTRGDLAALSIEDDGLYGELEIKAPETIKGIEGDLIYDVSVSFDPDYVDKASGAQVGPALLHVGLVNDPYLKGMQPFQALSDDAKVIMLSESKESTMSKVTNDRKFDVQVKFREGDEVKTVTLKPGEEVDVPEESYAEANNCVLKAEEPKKQLTADEKAAEDKATADAKAAADSKAAEDAKKTDAEKELEKTKQALADANAKIALSEAEKIYDGLLHEGKIVPAQRDAFISLSTAATAGTISLADNSTVSLHDLVTNLFKGAPKRINFGEDGSAGDENEKTPWDELSEEEKAATEAIGVTREEYNEVNGTTKETKKEA